MTNGEEISPHSLARPRGTGAAGSWSKCSDRLIRLPALSPLSRLEYSTRYFANCVSALTRWASTRPRISWLGSSAPIDRLSPDRPSPRYGFGSLSWLCAAHLDSFVAPLLELSGPVRWHSARRSRASPGH